MRLASSAARDARATARRRTPVPGTEGHLFLRPPQLPDARTAAPGCGGTVVQQPLPCPPQTGPRWPRAASARSQRQGQGRLPPSLPCRGPSPSSLLPLLRKRVVLGRGGSGETQHFAGSPAATRAAEAGPPCLAGGFFPLARPRTSFLPPQPRRRAMLGRGRGGRPAGPSAGGSGRALPRGVPPAARSRGRGGADGGTLGCSRRFR